MMARQDLILQPVGFIPRRLCWMGTYKRKIPGDSKWVEQILNFVLAMV
jgi:hypothetical protein